MSLFLKNLPNSFFRTVVSSRPIFNKATSLFSSIAINLDRPLTEPSRSVLSVGRNHARSICFGSPNEDKKNLIWKKYNLVGRPYSKKPKPKAKSKGEAKSKDEPKKTPSGGVTCKVEKGLIQCQIDCEKLAVKKPKSESDLPSKKSEGEDREKTETKQSAKSEDCGERSEGSTKTKKAKSEDRDKKSTKSKKASKAKCPEPEKKPTKEVSKKQKKDEDRCEIKDAKALTGTWVSKKCVKYDFKCPGGVKEKGSEPEKVDDSVEMKKPAPPKKESKPKEKCDSKDKEKKEEKPKGKSPLQECIEACGEKKKPQKETKGSSKSKKKSASTKTECKEKKKDDKSCKPCTSKKGVAEDQNESRHGSNTKLMCGIFDTKLSSNIDTESVKQIEKLTKELAECKKGKANELNQKINECLPSPKLDAKLPKPKEQDKDVVSGSKNFLKSVCDGIFSKDKKPVKSRSASAMSHTKSGDDGVKKSKSADCKMELKPEQCSKDKPKKKEDKKVKKSESDPCPKEETEEKKLDECKSADVQKESKGDCSHDSRPKPPCEYKNFKAKPTKKKKVSKKAEATATKTNCKKDEEQKEAEDCIELKIKKEGDRECLELPPCETETKKMKTKTASKDSESKAKISAKSEKKKSMSDVCKKKSKEDVKPERKKSESMSDVCKKMKSKEDVKPERKKSESMSDVCKKKMNSKEDVKSGRKKSESVSDVCKKKSKEDAKSEKNEVFCAEDCSKAEEKSKSDKPCPCPPPATRKRKRGKAAMKKSERKMICSDDPDRRPKFPPHPLPDDVSQKKPKGKISPEKKDSKQLVELCRKIGAAAVAATKKKSEDQSKYPGPPDQSPIMQCIALCKKKQKADKPQKGKGVPPRDKKPCSADKKVYKKIVEFNEETEKRKSQDEIKPFVPCQHEEIKPGIRNDGRGDVEKKAKSEDDRCNKKKRKQTLPKCPTHKKTKKKGKKKAKSRPKEVKKKESEESVAEDKSEIGKRTCPKIANPCKSKNEDKIKSEVICDCPEEDAKKGEKKENKDIVCDCSEKEEKTEKSKVSDDSKKEETEKKSKDLDKGAKKKAKSRSEEVKKKESEENVAEDKAEIGKRTCPKIANPCKSKNENKIKNEVICDCPEDSKKGDKKENKDNIVCDCSEKEEKSKVSDDSKKEEAEKKSKALDKKEGKAACESSEKDDKKRKKEDDVKCDCD